MAASFFPVQTFAQTAAINEVHVYKQTTGNPPSFIVEITGTNLLSPEAPRVVVFPSTGTTVTILQTAADVVRAELAAPANYAPTEVALSYSTGVLSKASYRLI